MLESTFVVTTGTKTLADSFEVGMSGHGERRVTSLAEGLSPKVRLDVGAFVPTTRATRLLAHVL